MNRAAAHLSALDQEIWGDDADALRLDHEGHAHALKPIADLIERVGAELTVAVNESASLARRTSEEMTGVVAKVVNMVGDHAEGIEKAVERSAGVQLEPSMAKLIKINEDMAKQLAGIHKTLGLLVQAMERNNAG